MAKQQERATESSLAVSCAMFGATVLLYYTVWKNNKRTNNGRRDQHPQQESRESGTTDGALSATDVTSVASSRLVRYLSAQHSDWTDYSDQDEYFVQDLPKIELHVHLDGTFDPHFLWRYMRNHPESVYCLPVSTAPPWDAARELPIRSMVRNCKTDKEFHRLCTCRGYRSLKEMLNCFEVFLPLVRGNLELIEQLAYDFCQRQYEQNVVYTEVRYSPHLLAEGFSPPTNNNTNSNGDEVDNQQQQQQQQPTIITADDVFHAVTKGLRRGCRDFEELTVTQILCSIAWRPDWARSVVDMAEQYRDAAPCPVVGVDIASGEEAFDAERFPHLHRPHYEMAQRARERRIPLTLHAGESTEHALENVRRAVLEYGAVRIGHGYRMVTCPETMRLVRDRKVHVEVCPTSSNETGGWVYEDGEKDWKQHPAVTMLQHGVSISLSSDDPAVFHTSLAWQYRIALAKMELTLADLVRMNLDAVDAAWCSEADKERLRQMIRCYAQSKQIAGLGLEDHPSCENLFQDTNNNNINPRVLEKSKTDSFADRVYLFEDERW